MMLQILFVLRFLSDDQCTIFSASKRKYDLIFVKEIERGISTTQRRASGKTSAEGIHCVHL